MSKPLDRDTALFQRFKALLAEEEKGDDSAADASGAGMTPEVFYVRLRERLFANAASQGVEFLDEVASSILADERDGRAALTGTVVLLPDPRKQRARTAAQLVAFKTEMALVSSKKRSATGPAGGRTSKRAKTPSPMKMLLVCSRLDAMQGHITSALNDDVYAVEAPESFRSYEGADSDVSDFEDEDGHPTALAAEARTLDSEEDDEEDDDEGPGTIPRYLSVQESSDDDTENGPDKEEEEAEGDGDDESTASPAAASKESPPNPSSAPSTSAPKKKSSPTPTSGKPTPPKDAASKGKNAFSSK
ncbi:hypothetical protein BBJ28_00023772 [Nothophytophthora sp. Chile5]|nr:hypothetical protein BBJ28_00023772 [Nothophytophthora sp. Chile5]